MSSELRLKKLRGSGGYVMAKVTDEQQAKGNLGGPDLFLAPVGRISTDMISRHFCNTCEKEFDGTPKIDYESPNEEVAQNLVLVEKGQYVCNGCGSTIAEYREFKKTDEGQEVGLARPIQKEEEAADGGGGRAPPRPGQEASMNAAGAADAQSQQQAPPPPRLQQQPEHTPPAEQQPQAASTKPEPAGGSSVSSIEGMAVFDENAKKIGTARQVGVNTEQKVVLIIAQADGSEASVPWARVKTVGEVILLGSPDAPAREPAKGGGGPGGCPNCGFANKADARFCEECGAKLPQS